MRGFYKGSYKGTFKGLGFGALGIRVLELLGSLPGNVLAKKTRVGGLGFRVTSTPLRRAHRTKIQTVVYEHVDGLTEAHIISLRRDGPREKSQGDLLFLRVLARIGYSVNIPGLTN